MVDGQKVVDQFLQLLQEQVEALNKLLTRQGGDWTVRGVIDSLGQIYALSADTKLISKIMELVMLPHLLDFAREHNYRVVLPPEQNYYPDLTFIDSYGNKFAIDIKSAYRINNKKVSTMTLGSFTGYFRNRNSTKNITFPYKEYSGHFILGIIYTRKDIDMNHSRVYHLDELREIPAIISDLYLFVQPKYKIASDKPGSGNTKNIGAIRESDALIRGEGPFASLGEAVFDDYWMNYLTPDMARNRKVEPPYSNLDGYRRWRQGGGD
jgi:hypothetical protein